MFIGMSARLTLSTDRNDGGSVQDAYPSAKRLLGESNGLGQFLVFRRRGSGQGGRFRLLVENFDLRFGLVLRRLDVG